IKDPKWVSVHGSQRQHSRRALPVRDASENEANLNSRVWIAQKLDVVQRAGSFAQFQLDVRTRKNVAVSLANVFKRGTLEPRSHRDRRRGRRNEIDQQQRDCAYCKHGRSRCFEDLPATESQHSHFPEPQSAVMKANSLCHRGVRATNGHAAAAQRDELAAFHSSVSVLRSKDSTLQYGGRLLRCGISSRAYDIFAPVSPHRNFKNKLNDARGYFSDIDRPKAGNSRRVTPRSVINSRRFIGH